MSSHEELERAFDKIREILAESNNARIAAEKKLADLTASREITPLHYTNAYRRPAGWQSATEISAAYGIDNGDIDNAAHQTGLKSDSKKARLLHPRDNKSSVIWIYSPIAIREIIDTLNNSESGGGT